MTDETIQFIRNELYATQSSPEQIAGRPKKVRNIISLHHETHWFRC